MRIHGALVEVLGVGVLLLGPSGIGKSECALELVTRGHRLVADDVVELERRRGAERLVGRRPPERIRHYMEIRGIGILFVPDLFGPEAVRDRDAGRSRVSSTSRLGSRAPSTSASASSGPTEELAGVGCPALVLPARPAASMATAHRGGGARPPARGPARERGASAWNRALQGCAPDRRREPVRP